MRAVVFPAAGAVEVLDVPDPEPAADQVVVRVAACGICGTDLHTLHGTNPMARYPCRPGHEFAGEVVAVGPAVTSAVGTPVPGIAVGARVAVDPSRSCGVCRPCRDGRGNLCADKGGHGSRLPGGLAEYVAVDAAACYPLPAGVPTELGALAEPLACAVHAVDRLGPVAGRTVLVYGAGPIGDILARLLARAGAARLAVVDTSEDRLGTLGAPVDERATSAAELAGATEPTGLSGLGGGTGPEWDVVVDATGAPSAIADGLGRVRAGGRVLLVGVATPGATVPLVPYDVYRREITVTGSMAILDTVGRAVELLADPRYDWGSLVSHRLPLDRTADALALVGSARGRKVLVTP